MTLDYRGQILFPEDGSLNTRLIDGQKCVVEPLDSGYGFDLKTNVDGQLVVTEYRPGYPGQEYRPGGVELKGGIAIAR